MDLTSFSSVGTQTPTEDRVFEFPECFSSSPHMSRSSASSSSIGTQTSVSRRSSSDFESSDANSVAIQDCQRPKLFRRHSTGSDVYNFSSSPTLLTAFRGAPFAQRGMLTQRQRKLMQGIQFMSGNAEHRDDAEFEEFEDSDGDLESVGQQLRKIGDDWDRVHFRSRSLSVSRFFVSVRRRTSSSSS